MTEEERKLHIRERKQKWYAANFDKEMARMKLYREANTEHINATRRDRYTLNAEPILQQNKAWRERNPEYEKERYANDPEASKKRNEEYRAANVERIKEYSKQYYAENAAARIANTRRWEQEHPEEAKRFGRKRRALKRGAQGEHTAEEWRAIVEKYKGYCLCCKKYFGLSKLTEDHIVPLTKGGSDHKDNLQPLCYSCNSAKGNRHSTDYRTY